jgi:uncharacterized protein (DUF1919 family)
MARKIRLEIDIDKLLAKMEENGVKSYKELAHMCSIPWRNIYMILYRQAYSKETLYIMAQELNCTMDDITTMNWNADERKEKTQRKSIQM